MKKILFCLLTLPLAACVNTPKQLRGEFSDIDPKTYRENPTPNTPVRWGGLIVKTTPKKDQTCIEILGKQTDKSGRPRLKDKYTTGRFIACKPGFYDPAIYKPDRRITVKGVANGLVEGTIGEYPYKYPKVDADTFYLWYDFDYTDRYYRPAVYGGGWLWYYPYSAWYYSGPGIWWGWYEPFPYRAYHPRYRDERPRHNPRLDQSDRRPTTRPRLHRSIPRSRSDGGAPRRQREK